MNLAPYASDPLKTKGRVFVEERSVLRNDFQRDRDRIIHSASFRRLQYKTQVFVNHEGDMFRSRLTHSIEVSQISRAVARTLNCHEDLAEAISLAHDLGHTPFGHAGQDALNECMRNYGGFEHNLQSLRVVDYLEKKYVAFDGLNLTFEVREGILKHCSARNAKKLGVLGERFLLGLNPSLESQIVNIADEIAYCHHDLDDAFRSGILNLDLLNELKLFNRILKEVKKIHSFDDHELYLNEVLRRMMSEIISDLCLYTKRNLEKFHPHKTEDVRSLPLLVDFSPLMKKYFLEIKEFSRIKIYKHPRIINMTHQAHAIIKKLFHYYENNYEMIPKPFRQNKKDNPERIIADYIAGMTDRFAEQLSK